MSTVPMIDADFGSINVPLATDHELPEPSEGFERIAFAANQAMLDVLHEDWALAEYETLQAA